MVMPVSDADGTCGKLTSPSKNVYPWRKQAVIRKTMLLCFVLVGGLVVTGCENAEKQALKVVSCKSSRTCKKPNFCLRSRSGKFCVHPCKTDANCPKPMLCSGRHGGRFGLSDRGGYCRRAAVGPGGSCRAIQDGCKKGLGCFRGLCRVQCKANRNCGKGERCVTISAKGLVRPGKRLFRACLKASVKEGGFCGKGGRLCRRGLRCVSKRCVRLCRSHRGCSPLQKCAGAAYKRYSVGIGKPSYRYCIRATLRENAVCGGRGRRVTCRRGMLCVNKRCARLCRSNADCSGGRRCHGRGWRRKGFGLRTGKPDFRFCK